MSKVKIPTIFISYSYDDDQHRAWVDYLSSRLTNNGFMVIYDQNELKNTTSNQIIMNNWNFATG